MYEKVNPFHPDKVADRIAGALTDLAYSKSKNPKIATEVLIGHGLCTIITETSECITEREVRAIVKRIAGDCELRYVCVPQDAHLADNQSEGVRCGDNGIFKGMPVTEEQQLLTDYAGRMAEQYGSDGKYIITDIHAVVCQSNMDRAKAVICDEQLGKRVTIYNPLGRWTGGTGVDSGATNRKLGSDMGDAVTGGGLHGKDLSKADVSVNIWCHLQAQKYGKPYSAVCAIGDTSIDGVPYEQIVEEAREYIRSIGGFERFAEWGLIRPNV